MLEASTWLFIVLSQSIHLNTYVRAFRESIAYLIAERSEAIIYGFQMMQRMGVSQYYAMSYLSFLPVYKISALVEPSSKA